VKKAIPVRMPDWPEGELPTTKQVEVYLLFWDHQRKQLASDPGVGFLQKSFWLDPEDLEISAYQGGMLARRPPRSRAVYTATDRHISQAENLEADTNRNSRGAAACTSNRFPRIGCDQASDVRRRLSTACSSRSGTQPRSGE
jgi:hypothetical protein